MVVQYDNFYLIFGILIQLLRYGTVQRTTAPALEHIIPVPTSNFGEGGVPNQIFLSGFFYSGALLVR